MVGTGRRFASAAPWLMVGTGRRFASAAPSGAFGVSDEVGT